MAALPVTVTFSYDSGLVHSYDTWAVEPPESSETEDAIEYAALLYSYFLERKLPITLILEPTFGQVVLSTTHVAAILVAPRVVKRKTH